MRLWALMGDDDLLIDEIGAISRTFLEGHGDEKGQHIDGSVLGQRDKCCGRGSNELLDSGFQYHSNTEHEYIHWTK